MRAERRWESARTDGQKRGEQSRGTDEVEDLLSLALEPRGPVRHDTLSLSGSDGSAEVGLARLAEFALLALCEKGKTTSKVRVPTDAD